MNESIRNLLIGVAAIVSIVGLSALMLRFGELENWTDPRYEVNLFVDRAEGLRPGSAVEFAGVPVGVVDAVSVVDDELFPVHIVIRVDESVRLLVDSAPYAQASLLGGSSILEIEPGASTEVMPTDGTATIRSILSYRMIERIESELDLRLRPILQALDQFNEMAETYTVLGRRVSELLEPMTPEAIAAGESPNLAASVAEVYGVLEEMQATVAAARAILVDEQVIADAKATVTSARTLMETSGETLDRIAHAAERLEIDTRQLIDRLLPAAEELAIASTSTRQLVEQATTGDGTVGRMVQNPDLYNNLNDAAERLEVTLEQIQLLIEKFRREGVQIGL